MILIVVGCDIWLSLWLSILIAITIGIGKEVLFDKVLNQGTPSKADMNANLVGIFIGVVLSTLIQQVVLRFI